MQCKRCELPQIGGFVGQGFCRFHWAGQLQGGQLPNVPASMRDSHNRALTHAKQLAQAEQAFKCNPSPSLSRSIRQLRGALRYELKGR